MSAESNRQVVRRYFEEFHNKRQRHILTEIAVEALRGPTETATKMLEAAFPDYQITIEAQVAEGDTVATVWRCQATHEGEWASPMGPVAPTGKAITFTATTTLRLADGRLAEVVASHWDHLGILQQLGALPTATSRPGA